MATTSIFIREYLGAFPPVEKPDVSAFQDVVIEPVAGATQLAVRVFRTDSELGPGFSVTYWVPSYLSGLGEFWAERIALAVLLAWRKQLKGPEGRYTKAPASSTVSTTLSALQESRALSPVSLSRPYRKVP